MEMTYLCSVECGHKRTLMDGNSDPAEKAKGIKEHQWTGGRPAYLRENECVTGNSKKRKASDLDSW
eukprot:626232-Rhodomonas_salina.1